MSRETKPLKISVTGIDGSGKSTVCSMVTCELGVDSSLVKLSRPVYSIEKGEKKYHFEKLVSAIDWLHEKADHSRNINLVLAANTLNVVFQGRVVEPLLMARLKLDYVIGSRDYLIDPSVYADFYSPLLAKQPMAQRIETMKRITRLDFRNVIFLLTVPPDTAVCRIENRIKEEARTGKKVERPKWRHMHENSRDLAKLERGYHKALDVVAGQSNTKIIEIDTTINNAVAVSKIITEYIKLPH